jgi:hypothetical protein
MIGPSARSKQIPSLDLIRTEPDPTYPSPIAIITLNVKTAKDRHSRGSRGFVCRLSDLFDCGPRFGNL